MLEDGLYPEGHKQFFQFQRRRDAEHALVAAETTVRHQNVTVGIMSDEVAKCLDSYNRTGNRILLRNRFLEKDLQGFPGAAAEIGKKLPVVEEISTEDLRDADTLKGTRDEMPVGDLLEDIHAEPFPELHHPLLVAGWAEVAAFARKVQKVFMAAIFAFHAGKAVVQIAAVEITIDHLLKIRPPESVLP